MSDEVRLRALYPVPSELWKNYRARTEERARLIHMSRPDPKGPPDHTLIKAGEVWDNPVNRERLAILERPWDNPEGRATLEMTALVGARVAGEHRHPFGSRAIHRNRG